MTNHPELVEHKNRVTNFIRKHSEVIVTVAAVGTLILSRRQLKFTKSISKDVKILANTALEAKDAVTKSPYRYF